MALCCGFSTEFTRRPNDFSRCRLRESPKASVNLPSLLHLVLMAIGNIPKASHVQPRQRVLMGAEWESGTGRGRPRFSPVENPFFRTGSIARPSFLLSVLATAGNGRTEKPWRSWGLRAAAVGGARGPLQVARTAGETHTGQRDAGGQTETAECCSGCEVRTGRSRRHVRGTPHRDP